MTKSIFCYDIYTDGSAKGNDINHRSGGWAYVMLYNGDIAQKDCGQELDTTNQRMELLACLKALEATEHYENGTAQYNIYSDSAYLINCYLQGWYRNWEVNGYINSEKKPVKNLDLWLKIIPYFKRHNYEFYKVKGHAENHYNNMVDEMAQRCAEVK